MITIFLTLKLVQFIEFRKAKKHTILWHEWKYRRGLILELIGQFLIVSAIIALYEFDIVARLVNFIV